MTMTTVILLMLLVLLIGTLPAWTHSSDWGYGPSSFVGILVLAALVMVLLDRL